MKASELRKLYLSATRLYGFLTSNDLFDILKHYDVSYKKEQVLKDLKDRTFKMTRDYEVIKVKSYYVILNPIYDDEELEALLKDKQGKPFYYPDTLEDLLKYADPLYADAHETQLFKKLFNFISDTIKVEQTKAVVLTSMIFDSFKSPLNTNGINKVFKFCEMLEIKFPSEKVINKFLNVIQETCNNLRMPSNNGFTPQELLKINGPIDMNNVVLEMGPNMKENFLNGTSDPYEYLKQLETLDLPPKLKESFKEQLQDIIKEIENTPKA